MRITSIESRILGYDVREAFGAAGPPEGISSTWYRFSFDVFHTDEGIDGWTMQNTNLPDGAAMGQILHSVYAPYLIGQDPMQGEALWQAMRRLNRHAYNLSDGVAGTIDVALWDIRGKVAGLPIAALLGQARDRIPAYATARNVQPTPEQVYEEARQRKAEGYHGFKVQFWDGIERDIPRFRAAREAVGPDFPLMEDGEGTYSFTQALAVGRVLGELGHTWFEEPIPDRQTGMLRRLTDELAIPILSGETLRVHELAEGMRRGDFDIARGDVHMKEGITGMHKAAGMADLLGYELEVHGIIQPLLAIANLHVSCTMSNSRYTEVMHPVYGKGMLGDLLAIDAEGYRHLPTGPGLGVEMDWDWDWIDDVTQEVIRTPA